MTNAGHYLGTQQSLEMMHSEFYYPHTADRRNRDDWLNDGGQDMRSIARQKVRHILKTHHPQPIDPQIDAAIRQRFDIVLPLEYAGEW